MQPADLLTLTRLLKDRLSQARMRGHATESELAEAVERCEQIIQWLEEMAADIGKTARTKRPGPRS